MKRSVGESLEIQRQETASVGQGSNNKDIGRYVKTNTYDFLFRKCVCNVKSAIFHNPTLDYRRKQNDFVTAVNNRLYVMESRA